MIKITSKCKILKDFYDDKCVIINFSVSSEKIFLEYVKKHKLDGLNTCILLHVVHY